MMEAKTASSGATGRNGGHCRAGNYLEFEHYVEDFGLEDAVGLEGWEEGNVREVGEFMYALLRFLSDFVCDQFLSL